MIHMQIKENKYKEKEQQLHKKEIGKNKRKKILSSKLDLKNLFFHKAEVQ